MTTRNDNDPQGYCGFEVGQHVVYLDGEPRNEYQRRMRVKWVRRGLKRPVNGRVYTVRLVFIGVTRDPSCPTPVCLLLDEIHNPPERALGGDVRELGFYAELFRPLPKLRVEDFLAASTPKDVVLGVPA